MRARTPGASRRRSWGFLLALLWVFWPQWICAEIFRYQDESGNWHFTDDPPEGYDSSVIPDIGTSRTDSRDTDPEGDLAARLESAYSPITPIAYATLAVVSIRTEFSEGSGFFCSEQGHILTNRHVVRPGSGEGIDERTREFADRERKLEAVEANLGDSRGQVELMKRDLTGYEGLIEDARDEKTRSWATDAHRRLTRRYQSERGRIATMARSVRTLKSDLRRSKRELSYERRFAPLQKRFEVTLKDGTELVATLLKASDAEDLALLKLEGYRTPFLRLDPERPLSQGTRVFAIGNPLGMQDAVTSGVITQIAPDHLLTDAQILPGSSGGPLIRESGEVIGISVSKKVAAGTSKYAAGFGKVIPIALARQAFPNELTQSERPAAGTAGTEWSAPDQGGIFETLGAEGLDAGRLPGPGPSVTDSSHAGSTDSAPVRLIVRDRGTDLDTDEPARRRPRSLDFPPEGSGIVPPGPSGQDE